MNAHASIAAINASLAAAGVPGFPLPLDDDSDLYATVTDGGARSLKAQVSTLEGLLDVTKEQVRKAHDETGLFKDRIRRAVSILESEDSFLARAKALARLKGHEGDVRGREPDETGLAKLKAAEGLLADERAKTRDLTASLASLRAHSDEVEGIIEAQGNKLGAKDEEIVRCRKATMEARSKVVTLEQNASGYRTVIALHERTVARQEAEIAELNSVIEGRDNDIEHLHDIANIDRIEIGRLRKKCGER